jgi:hypothetical protein
MRLEQRKTATVHNAALSISCGTVAQLELPPFHLTQPGDTGFTGEGGDTF